MKPEEYPAVFRSADAASNGFQRSFLRLIKLEYALLVMAAMVSVPNITSAAWNSVTAFVLILSAATLLTRSIWKPEQRWYKARALAESVKTLTWRYAMAAHPFDKESEAENRAEMRENLQRLMQPNPVLVGEASSDDQVTSAMEELRRMPLPDRKRFYQVHRVQNQRAWYNSKAVWNAKMAKRWVLVSACGYVVAIVMSLARISWPDWTVWPIEPIIVAAGAIVGWVQIKKFNELATAYSVTAHEIGLINITLENADTVTSFSDFVNEAEGAFSREHTLWIARQAN